MRPARCILVCALLATAGCGGGGGEPARETAAQPSATQAAPDPEAGDARAAAERFLDAVWAGDLEAECRASSAQTRKLQGGLCDAAERGGETKPLEGDPPAVGEVRVQGDTAFAEAGDGVSLTLLRSGGRWGVDGARGLPERRVVVP